MYVDTSSCRDVATLKLSKLPITLWDIEIFTTFIALPIFHSSARKGQKVGI